MTEADLQKYLLSKYPKEDATCEWKEMRNLKNDFNGKEKDDVISYVSALSNMDGGHLIIGVKDSTLDIVGTDTYNYDVQKARLRMKEQCVNLPTEDLCVEEYKTEDTKKTVWIICVPKHQPKLPVYAHGKAFQRLDDSLVEITRERLNAILEENLVADDWSAKIVEEATINDLDSQALVMARFQFKRLHEDISHEIDEWDDLKLLAHAGIAKHGKITRAALILLGKSTSSILLNPSVAQVTWILKNGEGEKISYEHFGMPMLTNVDRILSKIRNLSLREMPGGTLFPDVEKQYDDYSIRELLHNCIAHEDYTLQERIVLTEEPGKLTFSNGGFFLPGTIENVLENAGPQKYYRNYCLCQGMVSFNMIDTIGHGIEKVFSEQKRRKCRMPEYTIDNNIKEVKVTVYARNYTDADDAIATSGNHQETIRKGLTQNQDYILLLLHKDGKLTIPELSEIVGIAQRNISENLKTLQNLGLLERVGGRKNGYWSVKDSDDLHQFTK